MKNIMKLISRIQISKLLGINEGILIIFIFIIILGRYLTLFLSYFFFKIISNSKLLIPNGYKITNSINMKKISYPYPYIIKLCKIIGNEH